MAIKRLPAALTGERPPDVTDLDLLAGLGLPGALAGTIAKVGKRLTNPRDLELLQRLLGIPLQAGRRLLRISSVDPQASLARLHEAGGERHAMTLTDLVKAIRSGVLEETPYLSPKLLGTLEESGEMGSRIDRLTTFGPKGGTRTVPRPAPPTKRTLR